MRGCEGKRYRDVETEKEKERNEQTRKKKGGNEI